MIEPGRDRNGAQHFLPGPSRLKGGVLLLALLAVGCAHATSLLRMPQTTLWEYAMSKYKKHKWDDAIQAFQQFTFRFPTAQRAEEARYLLADSYFGKREYITAASEFKRLASDYPSGNYSDDARFKVCVSYARLSPQIELDQKYTTQAIQHCQTLLTYYPNSPHADSAKAIIKTMRNKLAGKLLVEGEYYFKRGAYDSAVLYYDDLVKRYPESPAAPKALLSEYHAYQKIGYKEEAAAARQKLLKDYPRSEAAKAVHGGAPAATPRSP